MSTQILRRLLTLVPVLAVVGVVVFVLIHVAPGDPAAVMAGSDANTERIEQLRHQMGLDRPLLEQFWTWVTRALQGDLGDSYFLAQPVSLSLAQRMEPTGLLTLYALILSIVIGLPAGIIAALTVVYLPRIARLVRGQVLVVREFLYIEAALASGASAWRIIFQHILPNSVSPLIVQSSFTFAFAVIVEASLSYLGAGVPPEIPTWGNMLQEGVPLMAAAPWMSVFPGLAIAGTVLGLNLLGDGLRDCLDPRI